MDEIKTTEQIEAEKLAAAIAEREAAEAEAKAGFEAMQAESAKAEADPERAKEIAANQKANEDAGLIFPPSQEIPEPTPEEIKAEKRTSLKGKIELLAETIADGQYDLLPELTALTEAYKILYL